MTNVTCLQLCSSILIPPRMFSKSQPLGLPIKNLLFLWSHFPSEPTVSNSEFFWKQDLKEVGEYPQRVRVPLANAVRVRYV